MKSIFKNALRQISFNFFTDINKAVDDLGQLFNINVHKIRLELLEICLLSERCFPNLDTSSYSLAAPDDVNSATLKR